MSKTEQKVAQTRFMTTAAAEHGTTFVFTFLLFMKWFTLGLFLLIFPIFQTKTAKMTTN